MCCIQRPSVSGQQHLVGEIVISKNYHKVLVFKNVRGAPAVTFN